MMGPLVSLGQITASGTNVRITSNQSDPTARVPCHSFLIEVLPTNTGRTYVGSATMNRTTLVGVYAVLAVPTSNLLPTFTANHFNLADVYITTDTQGEGVLASYVVA